MRDNILNILKNTDKAVDVYSLMDSLNIHSVDDTSLFQEEIRKLEDEAIIYRSHKDRYMMIEKSHLSSESHETQENLREKTMIPKWKFRNAIL